LSEASEINLNLVTAISGSEQEEKVAALLFSQGCNIIYRALNLQLLSKFLPTSQLNLSIIYSKDFCDANELNIIINKYKQHRFIVLDEKNEQAQLMSALSQINRPPLIHTLERIENLTTVIGSPGAPGISTIANQIAAQISATVICANHHNLRPIAKSKVLNIQAPELNKHLSTLVAGAVVIDAGAVVLFTQTLADRRMNAHWLSESVACASKLIYVINANENGISYLAQFLNDFQKVIDPPPIIYLLNKQRFDRIGRVIQGKFLELVSSWPNIQIPYDHSIQLLAGAAVSKYSFSRNTAFSKQIVKIGKQLL